MSEKKERAGGRPAVGEYSRTDFVTCCPQEERGGKPVERAAGGVRPAPLSTAVERRVEPNEIPANHPDFDTSTWPEILIETRLTRCYARAPAGRGRSGTER